MVDVVHLGYPRLLAARFEQIPEIILDMAPMDA